MSDWNGPSEVQRFFLSILVLFLFPPFFFFSPELETNGVAETAIVWAMGLDAFFLSFSFPWVEWGKKPCRRVLGRLPANFSSDGPRMNSHNLVLSFLYFFLPSPSSFFSRCPRRIDKNTRRWEVSADVAMHRRPYLSFFFPHCSLSFSFFFLFFVWRRRS